MIILNDKKEKGFSLVEVIIAISINLLVVITIMAVFFPGLKHVRMIKNDRNLHSSTQLLINQFNYWIKQGANIEVIEVEPEDPEDELEYILRIQFPDHSWKIITKNAEDSIIIDDNSGDPPILLTANNIKTEKLEFTKMDRSIRIDFVLKIEGADETFSAITTVAQRNTF